MSGTVLFLGAGATKSVNGPMTDEILPAIFKDLSKTAVAEPAGKAASLLQFLQSEFHVTEGMDRQLYPGLPLLMSLLDTALDRRELFHAQWNVNVLAELRETIE